MFCCDEVVDDISTDLLPVMSVVPMAVFLLSPFLIWATCASGAQSASPTALPATNIWCDPTSITYARRIEPTGNGLLSSHRFLKVHCVVKSTRTGSCVVSTPAAIFQGRRRWNWWGGPKHRLRTQRLAMAWRLRPRTEERKAKVLKGIGTEAEGEEDGEEAVQGESLVGTVNLLVKATLAQAQQVRALSAAATTTWSRPRAPS